MHSRKIITIASLIALTAMLTGCRVVPLKEYQSLQMSYNELRAQNDDLAMQLQGVQGREGQLQSQLAASGRKVTMAEAEANRLRQELEASRSAKPAAPEGWQATPTGAQISVGGDLLFSPGRAVLTTKGRGALSQISATIKSKYPGALVKVAGHSDSDPIRRSGWKDNLELSAERAMAVTRELVKAGIKDEIIETAAYGSSRPVADNSSSAGKARNRRVVIQVITN